MFTAIYKHFYGIGVYSIPGANPDVWGYIMDDFGNLIPMDDAIFDQSIFTNTGLI